MNVEEIVSGLKAEGHVEAARYIEKNLAVINRTAEFGYMKAFVIEGDLADAVHRNQLLSLWTAYCLHHGLDVDTKEYDEDLASIWREIVQTDKATACLDDFEIFGLFMCKDLV